MAESPSVPLVLPREVVLASAGTGKTFRLSSRIVGLLNAGVPPHEILASTFTRKAAGEILERVLLRLARAVMGEGDLAELAESAALPGAPALDAGRAEAVLSGVVEALHRMNVSTLDAFFHRVARAFSMEMGLVPGWAVADEADGIALVTAAVDHLLERVDREEMAELLRLHRSGEVGRDVHGELMAVVQGIQRVARELDPMEPHPWGFPADAGEDPPAPAELEALARRMEGAELPLTGKGTPHASWAAAAAAHAQALRARDWNGLLEKGIVGAVLAGKDRFSRQGIDGAWEGLAREAFALARRDLLPVLQGRARALQRLAGAFEAAFREEQGRRNVYRFEDIPHLLLDTGATERGAEVYFRLDGRIRHLLLDEFQDTSVLQWRALEPLADEMLQAGQGDRSVVVVADPKQSIYGWRGGEPRLLERIGERSGIPTDALLKSYRSSPVVLDAVNRICGVFRSSGILDRDSERDAAGEWARSFPPHEAAFPERPGFVRVVQAPAADGRGQLRPGVLTVAADEVADLHRQAPGATVGVLCRTAKAVNRMIWELRRREIPVSEEGGGPVLDAWPVHPVLALLRVADHPGDRLARYVVAHSPLGEGEGLTDWSSDRQGDRVSSRVRRRLMREGYGATLDRWVAVLAPRASPRERVRLGQLVELGFRQDSSPFPLRPSAFVRRAESTRMEAPGGARVRVMTIHASKGLEFDAVVLPELESGFRKGGGGRSGPVPFREDPAGPVTRVFPPVPTKLHPLFPEVEQAARRLAAARFHDELSGVYVALTRARHALHLVLEEGREGKVTPAQLVREGLRLESGVILRTEADRPILFEDGDPEWANKAGKGPTGAATPDAPPPDGAGDSAHPIPMAPAGARRRLVPRVTASELEGEGNRTVADLLRVGGDEARRSGSVVHAWLELVEWLEDGPPGDDLLRDRGRRLGASEEELSRLLGRFRKWMEEAPLRQVLSRAGYPAGTRVHRELAFLHRDGDRILAGSVDRLLLVPAAAGAPARAAVVDFKTDRIPAEAATRAQVLAERTARYRPQVEAYRRAMAARYRLPPEQVDGVLVFLEAGEVREL